MRDIELAAPSIAHIPPTGDLPTSSSMWTNLLNHVMRHAQGIHMVYGKPGLGVPFVAEALEKAALAAGFKVASQDVELVNPSNWRRAVQLSLAGHVVIVRVTAASTEALHTKYQSLLQATTGDLQQLRSHVFVKRASCRMTEPTLNELQLFEHKEDSTLSGPTRALR